MYLNAMNIWSAVQHPQVALLDQFYDIFGNHINNNHY
jgi:hypothetical protein